MKVFGLLERTKFFLTLSYQCSRYELNEIYDSGIIVVADRLEIELVILVVSIGDLVKLREEEKEKLVLKMTESILRIAPALFDARSIIGFIGCCPVKYAIPHSL